MRVVVTTSLLSILAGLVLPAATETAEANGDTRTISLFHAHRRDSIEITYRVNGHYDTAALQKLNYFLRDWRNDDQTNMDPRLFDVVWEVYRSAGADEPITVLSAYRSPETNAMLRRRSRAVAEHSQHMLGKAMDTTMPNMSMERLREIGMRMQRGGVGYYPSENFVHLDVGSVRHWPRMNYDQLVRLFPDGKTVHIPSNGQPLARYEEARAEIEANGGIAPGYDEQPKSKGFFAWLFGGGGGEDDAEEVASSRASQTRVASRGRAPAQTASAQTAPTQTASFVASADPQTSQVEPDRSSRRGTPDAASMAPASQSQQVASLTPTPRPRPETGATLDDDASTYGALMPIPPKRPSELMTLASVPLPPARPTTVASLAPAASPIAPTDMTASITPEAKKPQSVKPDQIASLISHEPAIPARTDLPAVITQGPDKVKTSPADVLAYAAEPAPASSLTAPLPGLRSAAFGKPGSPALRTLADNRQAIVSARLDGSNFRSLTSDVAEEDAPTQSVLGASLSGLRAAARIQAGTLSNRLSANYVTKFASTATDLDPSHFTGPAVQLLPSANEALRQVASYARPRN